jgi:transcriptional regulator with XRE-family HTH domain
MTVKGHFANPARIKAARLAANMSRSDLAFAIRQHTGGAIKTTERGVAGWENKEYAPSDGVIPAIAAVTGKEIGFFYEADSDDDGDEGRALLRDLRDLPTARRCRSCFAGGSSASSNRARWGSSSDRVVA